MDTKILKAWFFVFRPWSFAATAVPFLVAIALAPSDWNGWRFAAGLTAGLLFQATANLLNTWGDEKSGVDAVPGAIRTTPQVHEGLIALDTLFAVAILCACTACAIGLALCFYRSGGEWRFSFPLLTAGIIGFLGAANYSTGIKFKYRGLGVPFVAFLMGPLEIFVALTVIAPGCEEYAAGRFIWQLTLTSLPVSSLVCVIMHGNDMRDIPTDRAAGIRTPATMLGPKGALMLYHFCHLLPYAMCAWLICRHGRIFLLPFMAFPLTRRTLTAATGVWRTNRNSPPWLKLERASGAIHLVFGILYAIAWRVAVCRN